MSQQTRPEIKRVQAVLDDLVLRIVDLDGELRLAADPRLHRAVDRVIDELQTLSRELPDRITEKEWHKRVFELIHTVLKRCLAHGG